MINDVCLDLVESEINKISGGCWCVCRFKKRSVINLGFYYDGKKIVDEDKCFRACISSYNVRYPDFYLSECLW